MPTLVIFITLAIILSILLAFIVLMPWLRADKSAQNEQLIALNVDVFKERLKELQSDYDNGQINKSEFIAQKTELERQLLQASEDKSAGFLASDNTTDDEKVKVTTRANQDLRFTQSAKARFTILLCIPLLIIFAYILSANRTPVMELWDAQDRLGQVANGLMTGTIDNPPQWATEDSEGLLGAIQTNVHHNAHDAMRWVRLSDIYLAFEADGQAMEALARAYRLKPEDEAIAVRYAQTQFFTSGGMLNSDSRKALVNVLQNNPNHQGAQMLMAMGDARSGNYEQAQAWIQKLREGIQSREGDHSEALQSLDKLSDNIAAQEQAKLNNLNETNSASDLKRVKVRVLLNSSLYPLLETTDVLYVTVKQASGGAPLAVKRMPASNLSKAKDGFEIELTDDDAMMPSNTISSAMEREAELVVTARISKSGQAIAEAGDLAAEDVVLDYSNLNNNFKVTIEINQQLP